jgi:hypothetical protein
MQKRPTVEGWMYARYNGQVRLIGKRRIAIGPVDVKNSKREWNGKKKVDKMNCNYLNN